MFPLWVTAVLVTAVVVGVWHRRALATSVQDGDKDALWQLGLGLVATLVAIVLVLTLRSPALWVLVLGVVVAGSRLISRRSKIADITTAVNVPLLAGLFGIMIALGTAARTWSGPADLMAHAGSVASAALGAATSIVINNLPAAIVLASGIPQHPRALLLGLDVGPNIAVTGSLSAIFWLQVAGANGAEVSAARYARIGAVVGLASIASALAVMSLGS
jgi:arsenical pump membrane protein